jgi:hypothetical protein
MAISNAFKFANNILTNGGYDAADLVGAAGGTNTPAFSAYITASNTGSDNVATKCKFDTELYDTNNAFDTTNNRFTVPSGQAGKYHFSASFISYEATANNNITAWQIYFYKNGTNQLFVSQGESASSGGYRINSLSTTLNLTVGDYIEVYFRVDTSSGSIQVESGSEYNRFSGFKLTE